MRIYFISTLLILCSWLNGQELFIDSIPGSEQTFTLKFIQGNDSIPNFYMGTHEVTFDFFVLFKRKEFDTQYSDLSDDYTPDAITRPTPPYEDMTWGMGTEGGFPAVSMTQNAALRFCEWLYLKTGRFYRLPSVDEWTLVANKLTSNEGWFSENSTDKYHVTGELENDLGIYDMFGNVLEWTMHKKKLKGGSFIHAQTETNAETIFPYDRNWQKRDPQIPKSIWWLTDGSFIGFRLISPEKQPSSEEIEAFFQRVCK